MKRFMILLCVVAVVGLGGFASAAVTVSPSNMNGWITSTYDGNGNPITSPNEKVNFVSGPAGQPLGSGSANLLLLNSTGDGNAALGTNQYAGTPLSAITSLSYFTYCTTNNGQQFPYIAVNVNLEGNGTGPVDDTLFFEPPYQTPSAGNPSLPNQGGTVMNAWQSWSALSGAWWDNNNIMSPGSSLDHPLTPIDTLSYYLSQLPNTDTPVITSGAIPGFASYLPGGISFNVGWASAGDQFNGNVDDFTIGVSNVNTTYDFEVQGPVPEPATMIVWSLLGSASWPGDAGCASGSPRRSPALVR